MNNRLYVGNLPFTTTEIEIEELFAQHGTVSKVSLILDRATQRSRGFAFVTMETAEGAAKAMQALNGHVLEGRAMQINEARPKTDFKSPRPYGGGSGGFGERRGGKGGEEYREHRRGGSNQRGGSYRDRDRRRDAYDDDE